MSRLIVIFTLMTLTSALVRSQEMVFPVIKDYGGIYEIPDATLTPASDHPYKIVVDLYSGDEAPNALNSALNNVARMINLHAVGGVDPREISVVVAIHGKATNLVLNDMEYQKKFGVTNPNLGLISALSDAGVRIAVCGQSLLGRDIAVDAVNDDIEIATSMLTTVTHFQSLGYGLLKF